MVYPCTKFEVSSFARSKFTEGVLKFKIQPLDPDHAPFAGILSFLMGLAKFYPYTEFEVSGFTRSKDTPAVPIAMAKCARGFAQINAWSSVVFNHPIKSSVNIVKWSMFNANVLNFRYVFAL